MKVKLSNFVLNEFDSLKLMMSQANTFLAGDIVTTLGPQPRKDIHPELSSLGIQIKEKSNTQIKGVSNFSGVTLACEDY